MMLNCVILPFARPGILHPKHQVIFYWAGVTSAHACCVLLQQRGQTPHLVQDCAQKLVSILNTHMQKEEFIHRAQAIWREDSIKLELS